MSICRDDAQAAGPDREPDGDLAAPASRRAPAADWRRSRTRSATTNPTTAIISVKRLREIAHPIRCGRGSRPSASARSSDSPGFFGRTLRVGIAREDGEDSARACIRWTSGLSRPIKPQPAASWDWRGSGRWRASALPSSPAGRSSVDRGRRRPREPGRRDADDREAVGVQRDRACRARRDRRRTAPPQAHRPITTTARQPGSAILPRAGRSVRQRRPHAEHVEVVAARRSARSRARSWSRRSRVNGRWTIGGQPGQHVVVIAQSWRSSG